MLERVRALTREYDMLPAGGTVLCAVSGGADSMCMLHLLHAMGEQGGFQVAAAHFNHRLRGEESERDEAFVRQRCGQWHIPLTVGSGDVAAQAARQGAGVEETARAMRYAFLQKAAEEAGACRIATAHNADDNAETLLLHLIRGTGLQGLTGIPPRRGEIVRPLLTVSRAEITDYLERQGIDYVEDSSNTDQSYTRNYLRCQVMPLLRACNPRLIEHMGQTIGYLRCDNDYLNAQAYRACQAARWAEDDLVIEASVIAALPNAVAPRAVRRLLEMMGDGETNCSAAHLNAVVELCRGEDPSAVAFLPHGRLAQRIYKELLLTTQADPGTFDPVPLDLDGETEAAGWVIACRPARCPDTPPRPDHFYLAAPLGGEVVARPRQVGDEICLPHRPGHKRVKRLMIDAKLPRRERERVPVLADSTGVLAVAGFGPEEGRLARPGADAFEVTLRRGAGEEGKG